MARDLHLVSKLPLHTLLLANSDSTSATGWYNQSLSETVLEILDFQEEKPESGMKIDTKTEAKTEKKPWDKTGWVCVEGGTQKVARKMAEKLKKQPEFHRQVTGIATDTDRAMTLAIKHTEK